MSYFANKLEEINQMFKGFLFLIADPDQYPDFHRFTLENFRKVNELLGEEYLVTFFSRPNENWLSDHVGIIKQLLDTHLPQFSFLGDTMLVALLQQAYQMADYDLIHNVYGEPLNLPRYDVPTILYCPFLEVDHKESYEIPCRYIDPVDSDYAYVYERLAEDIGLILTKIKGEVTRLDQQSPKQGQSLNPLMVYQLVSDFSKNFSLDDESRAKLEHELNQYVRRANSHDNIKALLLNKDFKLCLKENHQVLKTEPKHLAVYLCFWKYRNGLYFHQFEKRCSDLFHDVYLSLSSRKAVPKITNASLSESISRMNRIFDVYFAYKIAELYKISTVPDTPREIKISDEYFEIEDPEMRKLLE